MPRAMRAVPDQDVAVRPAFDHFAVRTLVFHAGDNVDPLFPQFTDEEVIVEQGIGQHHITGPKRVKQFAPSASFHPCLCRRRAQSQIMASSGRQRERHRDACQRKADSWFGRRRLGISGLILRRIRHGDVRTIDNEYRTPMPFPFVADAGLQLVSRAPGQVRRTSAGRRMRALQ